MSRIVRAAQARVDIFEIWDYIATENSPMIADAVVARIAGYLRFLPLPR
jgi:hypothetical protein